MKSETSFRVFFLKQHRKNSLKNIFSHQKVYFWLSAFDHRAIVLDKMHIVHWCESINGNLIENVTWATLHCYYELINFLLKLQQVFSDCQTLIENRCMELMNWTTGHNNLMFRTRMQKVASQPDGFISAKLSVLEERSSWYSTRLTKV